MQKVITSYTPQCCYNLSFLECVIFCAKVCGVVAENSVSFNSNIVMSKFKQVQSTTKVEQLCGQYILTFCNFNVILETFVYVLGSNVSVSGEA